MSDSCLVTGASGFIGSHLTRALVGRGRRVRALAVDEASAQAAREMGAEPVYGELSDRAALECAVEGVSVVYHLAAQVRPLKWFYGLESLARSYHEVNVAGTMNLAQACRGKIKDFIYFSSIAAVGVGRDLREDSPCSPATDYGKSKRDAELALLESFGRDGFPVKIVRPGQAYGPGNLPMLILFKMIKAGVLPVIGDGVNHVPFCFVEDLIEAVLLIEQKGLAGEIYFAVNEPATFKQFLHAIAAAMGRTAPTFAFPHWAFKTAADWKDRAERAAGVRFYPLRMDFGVHAVAMASSEWLIRNDKLRERLGFVSHTSIEEGVRRTVRWYHENRLL